MKNRQKNITATYSVESLLLKIPICKNLKQESIFSLQGPGT